MDISTDNGIASVGTDLSVGQIVERIQAILSEMGVKVFAVIDHDGEAAKVGMAMPPTKVVLFGSPKAGTPLMIAAPSVAIDLPLKLLVAQHEEGRVSISYNRPEYLQRRHDIPFELVKNIAVVEGLVARVLG